MDDYNDVYSVLISSWEGLTDGRFDALYIQGAIDMADALYPETSEFCAFLVGLADAVEEVEDMPHDEKADVLRMTRELAELLTAENK